MNLEFENLKSDLAELIRERRTINDFRKDCPPVESVLQAIELARWAPNHKLTEPWRFHLLGPESVQQIVELNARLVTEEKGEEAGRKKLERWAAIPGWLAVTSLRSDDPVRDEENYAAVCCAMQNLALVLWSQSIGMKWSTGAVTRHPEFLKILEVDPNLERLVGLVWYGYPSQVPTLRRREVSEITIVHP